MHAAVPEAGAAGNLCRRQVDGSGSGDREAFAQHLDAVEHACCSLSAHFDPFGRHQNAVVFITSHRWVNHQRDVSLTFLLVHRGAGAQVNPGHIFDITAQEWSVALHVAVALGKINQALVGKLEIGAFDAIDWVGQGNHPVVSTVALRIGRHG